MASFKPMVDDNGSRVLVAGEQLDCGNFLLPASWASEHAILTMGDGLEGGDVLWRNSIQVISSIIRSANYHTSNTFVGSEELTNQNFTSNLNGWTSIGWTWSSGEAIHTTGNTSPLSQSVELEEGKIYQLSVSKRQVGTGSINISLGSLIGVHGLPGTAVGVTHVSEYSWKCTLSGSYTLSIVPSSTCVFPLQFVSLREIAGVSPPIITSKDFLAEIVTSEMRSNLVDPLLANDGYNDFIGFEAGQHVMVGFKNTGFGAFALTDLANGRYNAAFGHASLSACNEGDSNTAVGAFALSGCKIGCQNTSVGYSSLSQCYIGTCNSAVGWGALQYIQEGNANVAIGRWAGTHSTVAFENNVSGNSGVFIGDDTRASADGVDYEVVLGAYAKGKGTGTIVLGGEYHTAVYLPNDNMPILFGDEADYSIEWDGDDAVHTITAGKFSFTGGNLECSGAVVGANIPSPTVADKWLKSTGAGTAEWSDAIGEGCEDDCVPSPDAADKWLKSTGVGTFAWSDLVPDGGVPANTAVNQIYVGTGVGTAAWTTDLELTSLKVENEAEAVFDIYGGVSGTTDGQATIHMWAPHSYGFNTPQAKIVVIRESDTNTKGTDMLFQTRNIAGNIETRMTIGSEGTVVADMAPTKFYPRRVSQSVAPIGGTASIDIDAGEMMVWRDSDDGKVYLMFNDIDSGVKKIELG